MAGALEFALIPGHACSQHEFSCRRCCTSPLVTKFYERRRLLLLRPFCFLGNSLQSDNRRSQTTISTFEEVTTPGEDIRPQFAFWCTCCAPREDRSTPPPTAIVRHCFTNFSRAPAMGRTRNCMDAARSTNGKMNNQTVNDNIHRDFIDGCFLWIDKVGRT